MDAVIGGQTMRVYGAEISRFLLKTRHRMSKETIPSKSITQPCLCERRSRTRSSIEPRHLELCVVVFMRILRSFVTTGFRDYSEPFIFQSDMHVDDCLFRLESLLNHGQMSEQLLDQNASAFPGLPIDRSRYEQNRTRVSQQDPTESASNVTEDYALSRNDTNAHICALEAPRYFRHSVDAFLQKYASRRYGLRKSGKRRSHDHVVQQMAPSRRNKPPSLARASY